MILPFRLHRRYGWRALLPLAVLVLPLALSGCGEEPVAVVNGQKLTQKEFAARAAAYTSAQTAQSVGLVELQQWIQTALVEQEAKRLNIYPTEEQVSARYARDGKRLEFTGQQWQTLLDQSGLQPEDIRRNLRTEMAMDALMFQGLPEPTDAELRQAFAAHEKGQQPWSIPAQVRFRQITTDTKDAIQAAKAELDGGASFELVASSRSIDMFKERGGAVALPDGTGKIRSFWPKQLPPGGPIAAEAVAAAFQLQPGEYSSPISVGATWVLVKLDERKPAKQAQFEDFKDVVRQALLRQKAQQAGKTTEIAKRLAELGA